MKGFGPIFWARLECWKGSKQKLWSFRISMALFQTMTVIHTCQCELHAFSVVIGLPLHNAYTSYSPKVTLNNEQNERLA